MNVVLYKPLVRPEFRFVSLKADYLGFNYLISHLRRFESGITVSIAYSADAIFEMKPDIIGISSVTEMWNITRNLISLIRKKNFTGPIIIGGPHITALPRTLPVEADCAVLGHGENTFLELIRAYKKTRKPDLLEIGGIAFRDKDGEFVLTGKAKILKMDELQLDVLGNPAVTFQISTVRGCPYHCFHCVEHSLQGKLNYYSPEKLLWIMVKRVRLTGNPNFFFQDDTFLAPPNRLEDLHSLMRKKNLFGYFKIQIVSLNANLVRDHTIPMLKEIGVQALGMGMESLNQRMLEVLKGGIVTLKHIDNTIEAAHKAGLPIGGSQVYGFPGETKREIIDSILRVKFYERSTRFKHWVCFVCQPLPGSRFWDMESKKGNVSEDMDFSTLRIDGDCRFFETPWYYGNEKNVPRKEFLEILKKYDMLPKNYFVPPDSPLRKRTDFPGTLRGIAGRIYRDILLAIEGRKYRNG